MSGAGTPSEGPLVQLQEQTPVKNTEDLHENSITISPGDSEATSKGLNEGSVSCSVAEQKECAMSMSRSVPRMDDSISKLDESGDEEDKVATRDNVSEVPQEVLVSINEVKNIVLQILSPYFDDDGGGDDPIPSHVIDEKAPGAGGDDIRDEGAANESTHVESGLVDDDYYNDTAQRYDHNKSLAWTQLICDGIMKKLILMDKPFKYVVHCMIMRKTGAGIHVCSSNFYGPIDGCLSHSHDLNPHIYAAITVYWSGI
ncbi:unnamed protein product [Phytomonas sp. Hart1]|nr:unnamed protein product [Phytomonas sp. Hart1]|eukprot:CCW69162.1 unnamed protein product [Phytomonas sp. isolate Hart1]